MAQTAFAVDSKACSSKTLPFPGLVRAISVLDAEDFAFLQSTTLDERISSALGRLELQSEAVNFPDSVLTHFAALMSRDVGLKESELAARWHSRFRPFLWGMQHQEELLVEAGLSLRRKGQLISVHWLREEMRSLLLDEFLITTQPAPVEEKPTHVSEAFEERLYRRLGLSKEEAQLLETLLKECPFRTLNYWHDFLNELAQQTAAIRKGYVKSLLSLAKGARDSHVKPLRDEVFEIAATHSETRIFLAFHHQHPVLISARIHAKCGSDYCNRRQQAMIDDAIVLWRHYKRMRHRTLDIN